MAEPKIARRRGKFLEKITVSKISYATYLLLMTENIFLRYDNRGYTTQLH